MHGFIVLELEKFIIKQYGFSTWDTVSRRAKANDISIDGNKIYPDALVFSLVTETVNFLDIEPGVFLEKFGIALAPNLLKVYKAYLDPSWKTMEVLEHTEGTMHHAVRTNNPEVTPPILEIVRKSPKYIQIIYRSKRNIPQLGIGVIKGIADYFGELQRLYITLIPSQEEGVYTIDVELSA